MQRTIQGHQTEGCASGSILLKGMKFQWKEGNEYSLRIGVLGERIGLSISVALYPRYQLLAAYLIRRAQWKVNSYLVEAGWN